MSDIEEIVARLETYGGASISVDEWRKLIASWRERGEVLSWIVGMAIDCIRARAALSGPAGNPTDSLGRSWPHPDSPYGRKDNPASSAAAVDPVEEERAACEKIVRRDAAEEAEMWKLAGKRLV